MFTYSIIPLLEENFDLTVKDVREQYEKGISTVPLFRMTLVPEGNPVWDKVTPMCELYGRFKRELDRYGVKSGVLVQASLGHGYTITPNPYQKKVNLSNGEEVFVCCPEDERFLEHFCGVMKRIAAEHPAAIMLDDDFRILLHNDLGCACPLHLARFSEKTGRTVTREELYEHIITHPIDNPLTLAYLKLQSESLEKAAARLRAAVDSVDPTIQGVVCVNGNESDISAKTACIFAGKGNPSIARLPNGSYAPESAHGFSSYMSRAAISGAKLRRGGVDFLLAETDTIPFNRYGKSARHLHAQYTASLLEGLCGAKHWITRFTLEEADSGRAFRETLAKHRGFYERVSEYARDIRWVGINSRFATRAHTDIRPYSRVYEGNSWVTHAIERMGLPFYFSNECGKADFLDGTVVKDMTDSQIEGLFEASVFLSSDAASDIADRGFGDYLGVEISDWDLGSISGETFDGSPNRFCTHQKNPKKLIPRAGTETLTYNFRREDGKTKLLAPAVTLYDRGGKFSVVFCGTPMAAFNYMEGFAFLNETRKKQLISLLEKVGALPVYYIGDNEVLFRAGYLPDGRLLTFTLVTGADPIEELTLHINKEPIGAKLLLPDGSETDAAIRKLGNDSYGFGIRCEGLYPVVLIIDEA